MGRPSTTSGAELLKVRLPAMHREAQAGGVFFIGVAEDDFVIADVEVRGFGDAREPVAVGANAACFRWQYQDGYQMVGFDDGISRHLACTTIFYKKNSL